MATDLATLAVKVTTDGVSQAQSGLDGLTRSGANAERQMGQASTASATMAGQMMKLAAAVTFAYSAYKLFSDVVNTGMRNETMSAVMNQIGKNVGISTESLKHFKKEVESTGVTGMEAMSALSKAMTLGLNLNQMKEFTTRVRDVAVGARDAQGNLMNTSQAVMAVMHGIQSGQVEVLRNLGVTVRGTEEVYKQYAASVGKTKEQLNDAQKAQAMMNEFMRASIPLTGAAAAADETVGKQLASMARYSEEAKVALWEIFQPAMIAGVQALTQAFKDLKTWAEANSVELQLLGQTIGEYVTTAGSAALETAKWLAVNKDLVITLGELYIIVKITSWVAGLGKALGVAAGGATALAGGIQAIVLAASGLGVLGAIKSFQGKGDTGQGIGSPGTATMGDDMWEYVNQKEEKGYDIFQKARTERLENMIGGGQSYISKMSDALGLQGQVAAGLANAETGLSAAAAKAKPGGIGKGGGGGGAGKSTDAAESAMKSFIETMKSETARAAGDTEAILGAWYGKQLLSIEKWKNAGLDTTEALSAAAAAHKSKLEKLDSDFTDWYNSNLGNQYEKLVVEETKKLATVTGNKAKEAQVIEVYDRKHFELSQQMETERTNLFKGYLDTMAGLSPVLADQLGYKREALALELKLADAALERSRREGKITQDTYEQAQAMQALVAQAKKYAVEREGWMGKGVSGGLKAGSYDRSKEAETRTAQYTIDAMKGAEQYIGETGGQALVDAIHGKKTDLTKMFQDLGDSLVKQLFKMGTTKLFDSIWGGIGKAFNLSGKGKPDGSLGNPLHVTFDGMGATGLGKGIGGDAFERTAQKAGKVGFSMGGDHDWKGETKQLKTYEKMMDKMYKGEKKDLGGIQKLQEKFFKDDMKDLDAYGQMQDEIIQKNQEQFSTDYMTTYQDTFSTMATNITGVWGVAQGLMTMAGVSGEAARYGTMVSYGMQGISLIMQLAKASIIVDAYRGAASAFAWVMKTVPAPANFPLAVAAAAITFAAISAYGVMGGSTAGIGGGGQHSSGLTNDQAAYFHEGGHLRPVYAHAGFPPLKSGEVPFIGLDTERVLSPKQTYDYEAGMRAAGGRPGENGGNPIHVGGISVTINNPPKDFNADKLARELVPALQKQIGLNRLRPKRKS